MKTRSAMLLCAVALAACAGKEDLIPAAPAGLTLPLAGRVLLVVAQNELERPFTYNINSITKETTEISDGKAMTDGAMTVLTKMFAQAASQPEIHPHFIVKSQGSAQWDRKGGRFHVTCRYDVYSAEGDPVGIFGNSVVPPPRLGDFDETLPYAYAYCFKGAADKFAASAHVAAQVKAGFPEPNAAAQKSYLRSLGYSVR